MQLLCKETRFNLKALIRNCFFFGKILLFFLLKLKKKTKTHLSRTKFSLRALGQMYPLY